MNNFSELQSELRRLSSALEALSAQVESLKEQDVSEESDYAALEEMASRDPLQNPALKALSPQNRERYLRLLSTAAGLDGQISLEQLLYLCRAAAGAEGKADAKTLHKMAC